MLPPVGGCYAVMADHAVPRAPEGAARNLVYKVKEFTS